MLLPQNQLGQRGPCYMHHRGSSFKVSFHSFPCHTALCPSLEGPVYAAVTIPELLVLVTAVPELPVNTTRSCLGHPDTKISHRFLSRPTGSQITNISTLVMPQRFMSLLSQKFHPRPPQCFVSLKIL